MEEAPQLHIDLENTTPITSDEGNAIFVQGFIMRKVGKFVTGTDEDSIMPIPVFYDAESKKVLIDSIPPVLREEYKDITIDHA